MRLSIVIVNWNVAELLAACVESLPTACGDWWPDTEVIVVDNASTDGSPAMIRDRFGWVRLISLPENVGFTRGNNIGIAASRGEYVFPLNPDTVAHPGSVALLANYVQAHEGAGIVGPRLLNPDGTLQSSRRRFPTVPTALVESTPLQPLFSGSRVLRDFYMLDKPDNEPQQVGWLSGAALLCRREALSQSGFFDPGFFMFSEEVDLCRRVNDAGWEVVYLPESHITHFGGQSTGQDIPARHINFNTSKLRYFRLHEGPLIARLLRLFLLGSYSAQLGSEAAKWLLGHKRALRSTRARLYLQVLGSGLRRKSPARSPGVLLITGEYPPARGGVGDYTCELQQALALQNVRIEVLTRQRDEPASEENSEETTSGPRRVSGVPLIAPRITLRSTLRALRATRSRIAHIQYQTGAYDMRPTVNFLPLLLRIWGRAQPVVTFHDLRAPYLFPKAGPLRRAVVWFMAKTACCIATNPEDAATLRSWGVDVRLIPIGSNIANKPPPDYDREEWRASRGISKDIMVLAYFGFLNSTKGLADLLHALKALRPDGDYRLLMVGGGLGSSDPTNRKTASDLQELAEQLGVQDSLIWTGYLDASEVSAALLAADIAVLPYSDGASFRRGSLLAVLAHGLPLVTTFPRKAPGGEGSEWPRLENGKNALLVEPGQPDALVDALRKLASDPALQDALRAGALALARFFSWERIAAEHQQVYAQLSLAGSAPEFVGQPILLDSR